jgi:DNA-binding response OmpR family regulator
MVEDDLVLARAVAAGLTEDGFDVGISRNLADALHQSRNFTFDAFVVDIGLPDGSGIDFIRKIRAAGIDSPILVLTARSDSPTTVEALDSGADGHVVKPESIEGIGARLRALHRRATRPSGPTVKVGELVLEPSRMLARRGEAEIDLTPTQVRLLEALMVNAGNVLSRDQLNERIHTSSMMPPVSNVIDVHVGTLRAKIDGRFGTDSIETVRGVGYRFRRPAK